MAPIQRFPRRALWLLVVSLCLLVAVGGSSLYLLNRANRYAEVLVELQNARILAGGVLVDLQDAETGQRGFLLTDNPAYFQPYLNARKHIDQSLRQLAANKLSQMTDLAALEADLARVTDQKMDELRQTSDLERAHMHEQALQIVTTDRGKILMDRARDLIDRIETRIDQQRAKERGNLAAHGHVLLAVAWLGLLAVIACGIIIMLLVSRTIGLLNGAQKQMEMINASLERRVRERTADLEAANEEVQRFAYIVSHDLRAPLVNVMGFTSELDAALTTIQTMLTDVERVAPAQISEDARQAVTQDLPEALGFIRSSTQRMDRLINAILKLSREGRRNLSPEPIPMVPMVEGLVASLKHQMDDADATVEIRPKLPDVISDRFAIEQIFGNLIDNAVKYLDQGRPGQITISGEVNPKGVRYQIEDNGRGIDERDRERVFELFRRAGKQDRPGDGIGLAHVRALVRRLGGAIDFKSEAGKGTCFFVQLPATLAASAGRNET